MSFLHEMWHHINQDSRKEMYVLAGAPIVVQAGCSAVTYGFNKAFNVKAPKTMFRALLRMPLVVGSVPLKLGLSFFGVMGHNIYAETKADGFACKKARARLELEAFRNEYQESADLFDGKLVSDPKETMQIN